jgi:alternate signal-mediated exported protein
MNRMTKGAIATGIGVALLLGGGGTLAWWSVSEKSEAGTITAGNLNLKTKVAGLWSSNLTKTPVNIETHKVIPGETLTYTKTLAASVEGTNLEAELSLVGNDSLNGFGDTVETTTTFKKVGETSESANMVLTGPADVVAVTKFEFKSGTEKIEAMNAKFDFAGVEYQLKQRPTTPVAAAP